MLMTENAELLDMDTLNDLRTMLDDGLDELLEEYLHDSAKTLAALRQAAEQDDRETLASLSHSLKGSSGNLGVYGVFRICEQLEQDARAGELEDPVSRVEAVEALYERTGQALRAMVQA